MNKKIPLGAAIAFMIVVAGITFCITMMVSLDRFNTMVLNVKEREEMYAKFADVDKEVRQNYAGTIDEDALYDAIAAGYVRVLDRYCSYLTKAQYEELIAEQNGDRVSIGVTTEKDVTGYLKVTDVTAGSPAELGGLQVGDLLISVDGRDLQNLTLASAQRLLKGEPGTKFTLTYRRDGVDTTNDFIRKALDTVYVDFRMIGTNGYIRVYEISDDSYNQFKEAVDNAVQRGATGLIFDLRNNTSDSLETARKMLDMLLPSGELGYTVDNDNVRRTLEVSDRFCVNLPMTVLVNGQTGCAAEYFAAVLKEYKQAGKAEATLIGTTTLGKSSIQEIRPLTDGSAINLTVAHFYPPSGTELDGVGLKPDYEVRLTEEQEQNFFLLTEETDPQLKKAIEVVSSIQSGTQSEQTASSEAAPSQADTSSDTAGNADDAKTASSGTASE